MFIIGALNPQVGNDRRNQLLQKLMQQYMGQQGNGLGLPPTNLMRQTPAFGTASPASSSNAPGGRPDFTGGNPISPFLTNLLGPGAVGRSPLSVMSPAAGVPAPGFGPGAARPGPPIGMPGLPTAPAGPPTGTPGPPPASFAMTPTPPANGIPSTVSDTSSPLYGQPNPLFNYAAASAAQKAAIGAGQPMGAPPTSASPNLIPLGNGVFYQPGVGVVGSPMGGFGGFSGLHGPGAVSV